MPSHYFPQLPQVTIATVTGVEVTKAHAALVHSISSINFGKAILIAPEKPNDMDARIDFVAIPQIDRDGYSAFILNRLNEFVETSHVLIIQADGYVLNPQRWDHRWLSFDYMGAPWAPILRILRPGKGPVDLHLTNRVGNGGFSLRSKRLLELTKSIDLSTLRYPTRHEDLIICHLLFDYLTERGIRFADIETAASFSIEDPSFSFGQTLETSFGFHGRDYLPLLPSRHVLK